MKLIFFNSERIFMRFRRIYIDYKYYYSYFVFNSTVAIKLIWHLLLFYDLRCRFNQVLIVLFHSSNYNTKIGNISLVHTNISFDQTDKVCKFIKYSFLDTFIYSYYKNIYLYVCAMILVDFLRIKINPGWFLQSYLVLET